MTETMNLAEKIGGVAAREFDASPDYAKPGLLEWIAKLPERDDHDLLWETASCIHTSALTNSWRGNWSADDCKASACYNEAQRRHAAAGHHEDCRGDTIYSQAFRETWISQGHSPSAYPPKDCTCGHTAS